MQGIMDVEDILHLMVNIKVRFGCSAGALVLSLYCIFKIYWCTLFL